jgi:hypothetical protein
MLSDSVSRKLLLFVNYIVLLYFFESFLMVTFNQEWFKEDIQQKTN